MVRHVKIFIFIILIKKIKKIESFNKNELFVISLTPYFFVINCKMFNLVTLTRVVEKARGE